MSLEQSLSRMADNLALIAGSISTLAEAVNGTYKGQSIYNSSVTAAELPAGAQAKGTAVPAPAKPRGRPPGSKSATPAADPVPTTPVVGTAAHAPATEAAPAVTAVDLRALVMKCIAAKQRTAAVAILAETGADGVGTLHPIHYEAVAAKLNALLVAPAEEAAE